QCWPSECCSKSRSARKAPPGYRRDRRQTGETWAGTRSPDVCSDRRSISWPTGCTASVGPSARCPGRARRLRRSRPAMGPSSSPRVAYEAPERWIVQELHCPIVPAEGQVWLEELTKHSPIDSRSRGVHNSFRKNNLRRLGRYLWHLWLDAAAIM